MSQSTVCTASKMKSVFICMFAMQINQGPPTLHLGTIIEASVTLGPCLQLAHLEAHELV
jgi:hypothetical protein